MTWRDPEHALRAAPRGHQVVDAAPPRRLPRLRPVPRAGEPPPSRAPSSTCARSTPTRRCPRAGSRTRPPESSARRPSCGPSTCRTPARIEYLAFPRLCALADRAWSGGRGDSAGLRRAAADHTARLDALGVSYRPLSHAALATASAGTARPPGTLIPHRSGEEHRHEKDIPQEPVIRAAAAAAVTVALGCTALAALPATAGAAAAGGLRPVPHERHRSHRRPGRTVAEGHATRGTTSVPLSDVKIRYYFKARLRVRGLPFRLLLGGQGLLQHHRHLRHPRPPTATADRYLEIGFTAGAGSLAAGADTGDMQLRFHRADWQPLSRATTTPSAPRRTTYGDWSEVTAQVGGRHGLGHGARGQRPDRPDRPTRPPTRPAAGPRLFDDFDYTGHTDPKIAANGWTVRSNSGGPGVPGAIWAPENVTFPSQSGNSVMNLETSTAGTAACTVQTEILTQSMKFRNGTYAARVKFCDAPEVRARRRPPRADLLHHQRPQGADGRRLRGVRLRVSAQRRLGRAVQHPLHHVLGDLPPRPVGGRQPAHRGAAAATRAGTTWW